MKNNIIINTTPPNTWAEDLGHGVAEAGQALLHLDALPPPTQAEGLALAAQALQHMAAKLAAAAQALQINLGAERLEVLGKEVRAEGQALKHRVLRARAQADIAEIYAAAAQKGDAR